MQSLTHFYMKKLFILAMLALLLAPAFAQPTLAAFKCVPASEVTEETPEEDVCVVRKSAVKLNPLKLRYAYLMSYVRRLEELGGTYTGGNRFVVMKQIFEIEKLA